MLKFRFISKKNQKIKGLLKLNDKIVRAQHSFTLQIYSYIPSYNIGVFITLYV